MPYEHSGRVGCVSESGHCQRVAVDRSSRRCEHDLPDSVLQRQIQKANGGKKVAFEVMDRVVVRGPWQSRGDQMKGDVAAAERHGDIPSISKVAFVPLCSRRDVGGCRSPRNAIEHPDLGAGVLKCLDQMTAEEAAAPQHEASLRIWTRGHVPLETSASVSRRSEAEAPRDPCRRRGRRC